nr:MAG TPA: hypothetical protein [Caudoviricetes sp.]
MFHQSLQHYLQRLNNLNHIYQFYFRVSYLMI